MAHTAYAPFVCQNNTRNNFKMNVNRLQCERQDSLASWFVRGTALKISDVLLENYFSVKTLS